MMGFDSYELDYQLNREFEYLLELFPRINCFAPLVFDITEIFRIVSLSKDPNELESLSVESELFISSILLII